MIDLFRLDVLSSAIAVASIWALGRKKWWGWLFNVANIPVMTILNLRYGLWAYNLLNAGLLLMYIRNAYRWRFPNGRV